MAATIAGTLTVLAGIVLVLLGAALALQRGRPGLRLLLQLQRFSLQRLRICLCLRRLLLLLLQVVLLEGLQRRQGSRLRLLLLIGVVRAQLRAGSDSASCQRQAQVRALLRLMTRAGPKQCTGCI